MADLFQTLAAAAIGQASHTTSSHMQTSLLEYSKALAENGLQLMYAVKEAGGNPRREEAHAKVDRGVQMVTAAISDLVSLLEKVESEAGFIAGECTWRSSPEAEQPSTPIRNGGHDHQCTVTASC